MALNFNSINNTYIFSFGSDDKDLTLSLPNGEHKCSIFINNNLITLEGEKKTETIEKVSGNVQLFIDPYINKDDFNLTITYGNDKYNCHFNAIKSDLVNYYNKHQQNINTERSSFMVLRSNPKLTGNIKIVVDSDNNLFLDTFQINSTLSNNRYRHIPISGTSKFANDVRNHFKDIPKSDFYSVDEDCYNIFSVKTDFSKQYNDTYFYGVKNNTDKLYKENFSLLAPLYINNVLPDFFVVFRLDGPINKYKKTNTFTTKDVFDKFLEEGTIIKTFDLRKDTAIGSYLRNIQNDIISYPTSVYMSMDQYNHNQWTGISIDKGLIITATESGHLLKEVNNQVDYDRYITNGFERNGLISSRLINLEFMFNDENSEDFKINRYFGIYIINHNIKEVYSLNEERELIKNLLENKSNIINTTSDNIKDNFIRLTNINEINNISNSYIKTPSNNIHSSYASYNNIKNTKIMNVNINEALKPGEHLRVIDESGNKVYEIIVSKFNNKEEYTIQNESTINYENDNNNIITYYRGVIMGDTPNCKITVEEQLKQLKETFNNILPNNIEVYTYNNELNFIVRNENSYNNFYFQRISSRVLYDYENIINVRNTSEEDEIITYFDEVLHSVVLNVFNDEKNIFYPTHFNSWCNRLSYIVNFINLNNNDIYNIPTNIKTKDRLLINIDNKEMTYINLPMFTINYKCYENGEIKDSSLVKNTIKSPNVKNNYIIKSYTYNNSFIEKINLYTYNKIQLNVAGLLPIKDFNFDVIDNTNIIQTENTYKTIGGIDEYSLDTSINGIDVKNIRKETSPENFYQYININSTNNVYDKTNCIDYINTIYNNKKKLDISVVVPTNCKWKIYGKDILNNDIKSSPFSPQAYSYYLQISNGKYNIFCKELDISTNEVTNYIKIDDNNYISIRDYILNDKGNPYDILSHEYFTKVYYNSANNSLYSIYSGQKLQLYKEGLDLSPYDNYMFAIVKSKSNTISNSPIEFIIDEEQKVILGIWYVGNILNDDWEKLNSISDLSNIFNDKYIPFINCDDVSINGKEIFMTTINNSIPEKIGENKYTYSFTVDKVNNYAISSNNYIKSYDSILNDSSSDNTISVTKNTPYFYIKNTSTNSSESSTDSSNSEETIKITNNITTFKKVANNSVIKLIIKGERGKEENTIKINFIMPINIRETLPLNILKGLTTNSYYTYSGYIQPEFKNIFEFDNVDYNLSTNTNIKFIGTNTSISKINDISQIWINKVSDDVNYSYKENDTVKSILSIDVLKNIDVTRTCWDDKFYKKYSRNNPIVNIPGTESSKDVKTFFGSHGMVIKQREISITNWGNYYTISMDRKKYKQFINEEVGKKIIRLNLTDALLLYLKTNTNIVDNWNIKRKRNFNYEDYISNIIENIYNINIDNNIELYRSKLSTSKTNIVNFFEEKLIRNYDKITNLNTKLLKENNKYYIELDVEDKNYNYAIKYTIKK